jgi:hypothetical protein
MVDGGTHLARASLTRTTTVSSRRVDGLAEPGRIWEALREGATLVLESLHRSSPPIARLCASLAVQLGHPVQANAYVTPPGGTGFAPHVDTHDVFVVQTSGSKLWEVRERSRLLPRPVREDRGRLSAPAVAAGAAVLTPLLEPGDCLYVPRGHAHSASAQAGDLSIHVTVGLMRPTVRDIAREVLRGSDDDDLRDELALDELDADQAEVGKRIGAAIERASAVAGVRAVLARRLVRTLPPVPVPPSALVGAEVAGPLRLGAVAVLLDDTAHTVVLPDRDLEVPPEHWATVAGLLRAACGRRLEASEPDGVTRELVTELVAQGVLIGA